MNMEAQRIEHSQKLVYAEMHALTNFKLSHPDVTDVQLWRIARYLAEHALPLSQKTMVRAWQAVR